MTCFPGLRDQMACGGSTKNWAARYPSYADRVLGQGAARCFGNKGWSGSAGC